MKSFIRKMIGIFLRYCPICKIKLIKRKDFKYCPKCGNGYTQ